MTNPSDLPAAVDDVEGPDGSFRWLFASDAGVEVDGPLVAFSDRAAAESWLADHHDDLRERGVGTVTLSDGERAVYGPLYLEPGVPGPGAESQL